MKKIPLFKQKAISQIANKLKITKSSLPPILSHFKRYYSTIKETADSGKVRTFYRPHPDLLKIQKKINKYILNKSEISDRMHGYRKGHSALTNARCHTGKKIVAKYDIKSFFPSIRPQRIHQIFNNLDFCKDEAKILTRLTTADYHLPHGFATSPMLANLALNNLSKRLKGALIKQNISLTFYSDDVTISGNYDIKKIENLIIKIFQQEGFVVNREKMFYLSKKKRQIVTGFVVNQQANLPRKTRKKIGAIINNCVKHGPSSQLNEYWRVFGESKKGKKSVFKLRQRLNGKINILAKTDPRTYKVLRANLQKINWEE